jgi:prepilin-type N-terminal cleavage/methylation domain-containing protein
MKRNKSTAERGFSLLEMMMVIGILSLVLAVTMSAINDVQKRSRVEEAKVDLTQESREFVEQMVRDLHQSGYPTPSMYKAAPALTSFTYAAGIVAATPTSIWFEGDVDGDGKVDVVQYNLITDPDPNKGVPAGQCPCVLQRGWAPKVDGILPAAQPAPTFNQEVDGVINSTGAGAWTIAFVTVNMSGVGTVANNVRYANYKTDPIFRYYDSNGTEMGAAPVVANIRAVRITVNTLSTVVDPVSRVFPASSMTASARIANK